MSSSSLQASDLDIFTIGRLSNPEFVNLALLVVENLDVSCHAMVLEECLDRPFALEFIFSGLSETALRGYTQPLLDAFNINTVAFSASQPAICLQRIVAGLEFIKSDLEPGVLRLVETFHHQIADAMTVLSVEASNQIDALLAARSRVRSTSGRMTILDHGLVSKASAPFTEFAGIEAAITSLGYSIPNTTAKWDVLRRQVLDDLKDAWKECVELLRGPIAAQTFRELYLAEARRTSFNTVIDGSLYVKDIATSLGLTSAKGFGPWQILLSGPAQNMLKDERRRSSKHAEILMRKLRDLSRGDFTKDNQKRLEGFHNVEADVFSAWITGDTRLIYCIDCVENLESECQVQGIRVLDIVTHAKMDKRLQATISSQLAGKTKDDKARCRERLVADGTGLHTPISFPRSPEASIESTNNAFPLDPDMQLEFSDVAGLQKYIRVSQAYINSLAAELDMELPLEFWDEQKQILEHPGSCYVIGRSGTGKTTTMLFKMLSVERAWEMSKATLQKPRQIFLTKSPVLAARVEEYFRKLQTTLKVADMTKDELANTSKRGTESAPRMVMHIQDMSSLEDYLPSSFNDLKDEHFPLFVTFEKLLSLLEADAFSARAVHAPKKHGGMSYSLLHTSSGLQRLVRYQEFLGDYWAHFPAQLTRSLDPVSVYSQILAVIEGSEEALASQQGCMDRQAYVDGLTRGARATFSDQGQRSVIYDLFKRYLQLLKANRAQDDAGRTRTLLQALSCGCSIKQRVDFLYVDEVQDILLLDALVYRSICSNPSGLFWTGDTAQTISAGSAFRFAELKAFMYRAEEHLRRGHENQLAEHSPEQFYLNRNYRSHDGIVKLAAAVVRVITKLWPNQIDIVGEERGFYDGPKPIFMSQSDGGDALAQFLAMPGNTHLDFGAKQCILVRDEVARARVQEQTSNQALVLTVVDSKGLEFDDVLLVNFFEDSGANVNQWRKMIEAASSSTSYRHEDYPAKSLCVEMKHLYVAITRARQNLVIMDDSVEGYPIKSFWSELGLIDTENSVGGMFSHRQPSSPEDWEQLAWKLSDSGKFRQAAWAFERAGRPEDAADAQAYAFEEEAVAAHAGHFSYGLSLLKEASALLVSRAEKANRQESRNAFLRHAGDCYRKCTEHILAADVYDRAEKYNDAALEYIRGKNYTSALDIIHNRPNIQRHVYDEVMQMCRVHYLTIKAFKNAMDLFAGSFDSMMSFLQSLKLELVEADAYEWHGDVASAAEIHLASKHDGKGVLMLLRDTQNKSWMNRLAKHVIDHLRALLTFGVSANVLKSPTQKARITMLLDAVDQMGDHHFNADQTKDLVMYRAIAHGDVASLRGLVAQLASDNRDFARFAICLDHIYTLPVNLESSDREETATTLRLLLLYANRIRLTGTTAQSIRTDVQRLELMMNIHVNSQTFRYSILTGVFIRAWAEDQRPSKKTLLAQQTYPWMSMTRDDVLALTKKALEARVRHRLASAATQCLRSPEFSPLPEGSSVGDPHHCIQWRQDRLGLFNDILRIVASATPTFDIDLTKTWINKMFHLIFAGPSLPSVMPAHVVRSQLPTMTGVELMLDWCGKTLMLINFSSTYLDRFVQAVVLQKHFGRSPANRLANAPTLRQCPKPAEHTPAKHGAYAALFFAKALIGDTESMLVNGLAYLSQLVMHQPSIDLVYLCQFIDILCVTAAVSWAYQQKRSFNGVIGPRQRLAQVLSEFSTSRFSFEPEYLASLCNITLQIATAITTPGSEWSLMVQNVIIKDVDASVKTLLYESLYASVRILALNIQDIAMNAMLADGSQADLSTVICNDLVQIRQERMALRPLPAEDGLVVHPVYYKDDSDILEALSRKPIVIAQRQQSALEPSQGETTVIQQDDSSASMPGTYSGDEDPPIANEKTGDSSGPDTVEQAITGAAAEWHAEQVVESITTSSAKPAEDLANHEEKLAALSGHELERLSQLPAIRRRFADLAIAALKQPAITAEDDELHRIYDLFHSALPTSCNAGYVLLYRGAAPQAFYVASYITKWADHEKKQAKKQSSKGIDGSSERQTVAARFRKKVEPLRVELQPGSGLYQRGNSLELRDCIGKLHTLVTELPAKIADVVNPNIEIAHAAAVKYSLNKE